MKAPNFLVLLIFLLVSNAFACEEFDYSSFDTSIWPTFNGYYYNCEFGYSVFIPKNLTAIGDSNEKQPVQSRGVCILLSQKPFEYISVNGDFNSAERKSINEITNLYIDCVKENASVINSIKMYQTKLNGYGAKRLIVKAKCSNKNREVIYDYFLVLNSKRQMMYEIAMVVDSKNYLKYEKLFRNISESLQLKPLYNCK